MSGAALTRVLDALTVTGHPPRGGGRQYYARCPAHDDQAPSLSVTEATDRVLLRCHANCDLAAITAALNLTPADLFNERRHQANGHSQVTAEYRYVDEAGRLLYVVERHQPKTFRQKRPQGAGWAWSMGDVRRVLYRLPEVLAAASTGATVYVVEGEKDADRLASLGHTATCNVGGAGKWRDTYTPVLRGAQVVVIRDMDETGRAHAETVAASLRAAGITVCLAEPAIGKDISEHLDLGGALDDLVFLPLPTAPAATTTSSAPPAPVVAEVPAGPELADLEADFWDARRVLSNLHTFARARRVAPWAVLGAVLARVVASIKPFVQLPPIIGSYASLNLFIGLVAVPGGGKDSSHKVAKDFLTVGSFATVPLGSGEGLSHMFMRETKHGPEQYNDAALVIIGEIDSFTALTRRQGSTVTAQLRQAAMGEALGFFYVDTAKRMLVPEHRYRLCLLAGIQPARAQSLLDDADGGTPQRFVWLPATDPQAPDHAPDCPTPMTWVSPPWHQVHAVRAAGMDRVVIDVCPAAQDTIITAHLARVRGQGDALDGHALLTRLKVAAALAALDGNVAVGDEDWQLAGLVMAISDHTRTRVMRALAAETRERNRRSAEAEASRTVLVQERLDEAAVTRVARAVRRALARADEPQAAAELRRALNSRDRPHLETALAALTMAGEVVEEKIDHYGQSGTRYRQNRGDS